VTEKKTTDDKIRRIQGNRFPIHVSYCYTGLANSVDLVLICIKSCWYVTCFQRYRIWM